MCRKKPFMHLDMRAFVKRADRGRELLSTIMAAIKTCGLADNRTSGIDRSTPAEDFA
jgi:hypothetical protein